MKKEILKGLTTVTLVLVIALAAAAVSANAQSSKKTVAAIPFEFVFGDKEMAAGEYTLKSTTAPANGVLIENSKARTVALELSIPVEPKIRERNHSNARLVFHRYGKRYFLAEVWTGPNNIGRQLLKSREQRAIERELATLNSKSELADGCYEIVEVVAVNR